MHTCILPPLSVPSSCLILAGGFPYPTIQNEDLLTCLKRGYRMEKPENCSPEMWACPCSVYTVGCEGMAGDRKVLFALSQHSSLIWWNFQSASRNATCNHGLIKTSFCLYIYNCYNSRYVCLLTTAVLCGVLWGRLVVPAAELLFIQFTCTINLYIFGWGIV